MLMLSLLFMLVGLEITFVTTGNAMLVTAIGLVAVGIEFGFLEVERRLNELSKKNS